MFHYYEIGSEWRWEWTGLAALGMMQEAKLLLFLSLRWFSCLAADVVAAVGHVTIAVAAFVAAGFEDAVVDEYNFVAVDCTLGKLEKVVVGVEDTLETRIRQVKDPRSQCDHFERWSTGY